MTSKKNNNLDNEDSLNHELECLSYFRNIRQARLSSDALAEKARALKKLADKLSLKSKGALFSAVSKGNLQPIVECEQILLRPHATLFSGTGMFRTLSESVLPDLINRNKKDETIRFWIPGCGNGKEAYSIGLFLNAQKQILKDWNLSVFATDSSNFALEEANTACIPYEDIDSVILKLYGEGLKKVDDDYIVKEDVRRLVTFQHGNFYDGVPDAGPFDVIVFRQHLQFWEPYQQEVIIENLSQALKPAGNLILANDESLLGLSSDFVPVYNVPGFYRKVA